MMRSREQLRKAVQDTYHITDIHERAFKLFVVEIELALDNRDLLEMIAKRLAPEEYEALKKVVDTRRRS